MLCLRHAVLNCTQVLHAAVDHMWPRGQSGGIGRSANPIARPGGWHANCEYLKIVRS